MPEMLGLMRWLEGNIPATDEEPDMAAINHGDFRLDNLVMSESQPGTVLAVLDWELSTLGDPLADLAYNCLPYHLPSSIPSLPSLPHPLPPGIPTEQQYIKMYCQERGLPYPLKANWSFYLALSIFRLCSILAGVGARAAQGNASSQIAGQVGADSVVRELALAALRIADVALAPAVGRPTRRTTSPASTPPPGQQLGVSPPGGTGLGNGGAGVAALAVTRRCGCGCQSVRSENCGAASGSVQEGGRLHGAQPPPDMAEEGGAWQEGHMPLPAMTPAQRRKVSDFITQSGADLSCGCGHPSCNCKDPAKGSTACCCAGGQRAQLAVQQQAQRAGRLGVGHLRCRVSAVLSHPVSTAQRTPSRKT